MKMVLLTGKVEISDQYGTSKVEISDQYGTSKDILLGVFDPTFVVAIQMAKDKFNKANWRKRTLTLERVIDVNQYYGVSNEG